MKNFNTKEMNLNVKKQDEYVKKMNQRYRGEFPLVNGPEFVKSIRSSSYKDSGKALNELVDNSMECDSTFISIFYLCKNRELDDVFVVDNGHGMSPQMIQQAVMWGGTHRHKYDKESRSDFIGAFGFGHPSACLFLTEEYETYSKAEIYTEHEKNSDGNLIYLNETGKEFTQIDKNGNELYDGDEGFQKNLVPKIIRKEGKWHSVKISIDDIVKGTFKSKRGGHMVPLPVEKKLPTAIIDYMNFEKNMALEKFRKSEEYSILKKTSKFNEIEKKEQIISTRFSLKTGTITRLKNPKQFNGLTQGYKSLEGFTKSVRKTLCGTYRYEIIKNGPIIKVASCTIQKDKSGNDQFDNFKSLIVKPVDPLFITEKALLYNQRGYDAKFTEDYEEIKNDTKKLWESGIMAKGEVLDPILVVNPKTNEKGYIRIRHSIVSPLFPRIIDPKTKKIKHSLSYASDSDLGEGGQFGRWEIMNDYNRSLFTVCRSGRLIDVVKNVKWTENKNQGIRSARNEDRYWGLEIDFDPVLDDLFGITYDKQQVTISTELLKRLEAEGIPQEISALRKKVLNQFLIYQQERKAEKNKSKKNLTSLVMQKHDRVISENEMSSSMKRRFERARNEEIERISEEQEISIEEARLQLERSRIVVYISQKELGRDGKIFDVNYLTNRKYRLILNNEHSFIKNIYNDNHTSDFIKSALEILFISWWKPIMGSTNEEQEDQRSDDLLASSQDCRTKISMLGDNLRYNKEADDE